MRSTNANIKPTVVIAGAATFGALAALISLLAPPVIQPSFPILFYLKFDIAEIADVTAFLIFGPIAGLVTATVRTGRGRTIRGESEVPIGSFHLRGVDTGFETWKT